MMVKRNPARSGWLETAAGGIAILFLVLSLAGCAQAPAPQVTATEPPAGTSTQAPVATEAPSSTPTLPPTATPEPSATPTPLPSATPTTSPLALLQDGFSAWCAPQEYQGTRPGGPDAPTYANQLVVMGPEMQVKIPAAFCALAFRFNQPAPAGLSLVFFDQSSAFLKVPLNPADGHPEEVWGTVTHDWVVNPPLWQITYRLALLGPDGKELWSNPVRFAKPLPNPCPFGGLPDPVTLYCTKTDPKEIEPHPDLTWPAYYTRVPPSH